MLSRRLRTVLIPINQKLLYLKNFGPCHALFLSDNLSTKKNVFRTFCDGRYLDNKAIKKNPFELTQHILDDKDEYLDHLIEHVVATVIDRKRVYKNDIINLLKYLPEKTHISDQNAMLFIQLCSDLLIEEKSNTRLIYLNEFLSLIKKNIKLKIQHYNQILNTYNSNNYKVNSSSFIQEMLPVKPDETTFLLLLTNSCQHGDMNQAQEILSNMTSFRKKETQKVVNILIEGYGKEKNIEQVLKVYNEAVSEKPSPETEKSLIKAFVMAGDVDRLKNKLSDVLKNSLYFTDEQVLEIILCTIQNNQSALLPECIGLFSSKTKSCRFLSLHLQTFCSHLIYEGYFKEALSIYYFFPSGDIGPNLNHSVSGKVLLRDCIKTLDSIDDIMYVVDGFIKSKRNIYALYTAYEASLHYDKQNISVELLKIMKDRKLPLRNHFLWPLLVKAHKSDGENGIFNVLSLMQELQIDPDIDTLSDYVVPYISLVSPIDTVKKLNAYGISHSKCFTPIMVELLKNKEIVAASELCELLDVKIDCEALLSPLLQSYIITNNCNSTHNILRSFQAKAKDNKKDWVGKFLINMTTFRKWKTDIRYLYSIIQVLDESATKISEPAGEICLKFVNDFSNSTVDINILNNRIKNMISKHIKNDFNIPSHVKNSQESMSLNDLNAHLVELESKSMNTRGVLRKLLQIYCKQNNFKEAIKILNKCHAAKIDFSDGMKASLLNLYIKNDDFKNAEIYFIDLMKSKFILDEFKVVDFSELLARTNQFEKAQKVLEIKAKQSAIIGGKNLETNCWKLLNTVSKYNEIERVVEMLELLKKLKYCSVSNILLGPLIRVHLNKSDVEGAVKEFEKCVKLYRKTPLKHELMCLLVLGSKSSNNSLDDSMKNNSQCYQKWLTEVQKLDSMAHGIAKSQVSLIAALADCNMAKELRKLFLDPSYQVKNEELMKQCEKFVTDHKLSALRTIADCGEGLSFLKINEIYNLMMKVAYRTGDCNGAIDIWNNMIDKNIKPLPSTIEILVSMLKLSNVSFPPTLHIYVKEEDRAVG